MTKQEILDQLKHLNDSIILSIGGAYCSECDTVGGEYLTEDDVIPPLKKLMEQIRFSIWEDEMNENSTINPRKDL